MKGEIYLLLGSNLGDRLKNLSEARDRIGSSIANSSIYMTGAWGNANQPEFLNQVIEIDTTLSPTDLLQYILAIEIKMGRVRIEKWGPRIIDIDILFYHDSVVSIKDLIIPHPEIQNRRFTLKPMDELAPNLVHPVLKKSIHQLLGDCNDPLEVTRLQPQL